MIPLKIVIIATVAFFGGAAVFFGWTGGVAGMVMSPVLAGFGWYLWPLILWLVVLLWWVYRPFGRLWIYRFIFAAVCGGVGFLVSFPMAGRGGDELVTEAFRAASTVAGGIAGGMIGLWKRPTPKREADEAARVELYDGNET